MIMQIFIKNKTKVVNMWLMADKILYFLEIGLGISS